MARRCLSQGEICLHIWETAAFAQRILLRRHFLSSSECMKTKFHLFSVTISGGSVKLLSRDTRAENMMCLETVPQAAPSVQRRKKNSVLSGSNWHVSLHSRRRLRACFQHGKSNLRDGATTDGTHRENREPPNIDVNTRLLRYHVLQLFQPTWRV